MQEYQIPFETDAFSPEPSEIGEDIDKVLNQKALLVLRYDDLQKQIMLCGFSPVMVRLSDDERYDDILTKWRVKLAMLNLSNSQEKIKYSEQYSDLLHQYEMQVKDVMAFLSEDYIQIGQEIVSKAGKSEHLEYLKDRIDNHSKAIDDFEAKLISFQDIMTNFKG